MVPICTKFGQLVFAKIIKIVATRCHILRLKCTKFDVGWGSAPDPAVGAYSAPPDPLAGFKGPTSKGRGGEERGREREGRGGKGREVDTPRFLPGSSPMPLEWVSEAYKLHSHIQNNFGNSNFVAAVSQMWNVIPLNLRQDVSYEQLRQLFKIVPSGS